MYKTFLAIFLLNFSAIRSEELRGCNLETIERLIDEADENTLVLWDVDQTLITPDDPILKPKWEKLLDQWLGGKKVIVEPSGKKRYVFREILMSAPHSVVDQKIFPLLEKIHGKGIRAIAFTAAPGGKIGKIERFIDWRIDELQKFGFDFSRAFPEVGDLNLPKDPNLEFPPMYKSGVLVTSLHDKGPVLKNFLLAIGWMPNKIIFVDDQRENLESVAAALEGPVQVIGVHYTAASTIPCDIDEETSHFKVDYFLKTGVWISERPHGHV